MLIPSVIGCAMGGGASLSRRVNANSQRGSTYGDPANKLIKKGEC